MLLALKGIKNDFTYYNVLSRLYATNMVLYDLG
jgi:hypothetical protein